MAARGMPRDGEGCGRRMKHYDPGGGAVPEGKRKRNYYEEEEAAAEAEKRQRLEEGVSKDPLEVLGMDMMMRILELSDACSVARCTVVSRGWHEIAVSDHLWGPKVASFPQNFLFYIFFCPYMRELEIFFSLLFVHKRISEIS